MTTAVIEAPETETVETPKKSASQIVREWPDERFGKGSFRTEFADGTIEFCAAGILCESSGFDWDEYLTARAGYCTPYHWLRHAFGLSVAQIEALIDGSDRYGKEYAADLLERWEAQGCLG